VVEQEHSNQNDITNIARETLLKIAEVKDDCHKKFLLIAAGDRMNEYGGNYAKVKDIDGQEMAFHCGGGETLTFEILQALADNHNEN